MVLKALEKWWLLESALCCADWSCLQLFFSMSCDHALLNHVVLVSFGNIGIRIEFSPPSCLAVHVKCTVETSWQCPHSYFYNLFITVLILSLTVFLLLLHLHLNFPMGFIKLNLISPLWQSEYMTDCRCAHTHTQSHTFLTLFLGCQAHNIASHLSIQSDYGLLWWLTFVP